MLLPKSVEQRIRKMRMMSPLWATPARMRLSSVHMCYFMTLILLPSTIKNSPEWWAKMGGFGWAYARQGALWVPKEKPTGGPGGG